MGMSRKSMVWEAFEKAIALDLGADGDLLYNTRSVL